MAFIYMTYSTVPVTCKLSPPHVLWFGSNRCHLFTNWRRQQQWQKGSIPVSETQTPPVSLSQVFLQYECAPSLTFPTDTPPQSACCSHAAAHTEENVAGLRSEDPSCRDYCQSEARDCGSGQALPPGDCGRSQPSNPEDSAGSKASEPKDSGRSNALQPTDIGCDLEHCGSFHSQALPTVLITGSDKEGGGHELYCFPWVQTEQQLEESPTQPTPAESPFFFPLTRPRAPQPPIMPVLPEEEEDSPEELDSSSSSPSTYTPVESRAVTVAMPAPTIVFPKQATVTVVQADGRPLEQTRPHSPRSRLSRNSLGGPITIVDSTGNVIDLVKDHLPELQLSEEDRQKNLVLLQEAKKVSDRFLSRRGRKSTCSLSESPTGLSPNHTPSSSPAPSRSSSLITAPQIAVATEVNYAPSSPVSLRLEVLSTREQADTSTPEHESTRRLVDWKPNEKRKVSSGTLAPRYSGPPPPREPNGGQKENCDPRVTAKNCPEPVLVNKPEEGLVRAPNQAPATGVAKPVPRPPTQQAPCTAEIKTIGAFPPLMRAVSWDTVGTLNARNGAPSLPPTNEETFSFQDKTRDALLKSSGYKDFPVQPVNVQKLSKIREEHKLMRNQSIVGSKLADLSETAEQERGSPTDEEAKEKSDAMPNISDIMLRKLKLHRGLPGCAPPLTEKEVENAFVQLSLAFRNDNYTLETRLKQAERERTLTEENTEKELEEFKGSLKCTAPQWSNMEQRESYQCLIETVAVLHRLATRLSSRAEMVGAVRQEKRMNKATEVMMQYVENLKRTYEKDHAELMEFKKLANQNSSRCYGGSIDTGDDGVPRPSRSMSLTLGKALPRRRVSVAVVPKFNLLNIPGQTPVMAGPGPSVAMGPSPQPTMGQALPVLCEANSVKSNFPTEPTQPAIDESGKSVAEQEAEPSAPAKPSVNLEEIRSEIRSEIKAKIEEEAYNKGYQEGLKRSKEIKEVEEEEEKVEEKTEKKDEGKGKEIIRKEKFSSKVEDVLVVLDRLCPKIFRGNRLLWIVLTLFLVTFLVVNVFTYFSDRYNNHGDMSAEKAMVQGKKKIFELNVGVQPKNPTPE
uniref:Murine retrovirus integration site 1 homolog n=1 Tax=Oncorhynchus tshawytscha TaxID=74940 RepID=A0AAZ3RKN3_ONCTS